VIVIRDAGVLGAGAPARLSVDGAPVARLWSGERVEFYLGHLFIRVHNEALTVVAMCVSNPDRSPSDST
jgi:hypothetical protein